MDDLRKRRVRGPAMDPADIEISDEGKASRLPEDRMMLARATTAMAALPADQAYVDDLYAANEALVRAFAAPLHEPVPEAIMATIMGQTTPDVVPFRRRMPLLVGGLALAASLVAVALVLPGLNAGSDDLALGPMAAADPMTLTLDSQVSGVPVAMADGRQSMVLASFAMPDGRFCREFELVDGAKGRVDYALGCRSDGPWVIEAVIAEMADVDQGYVPADGGEVDTLTRYLKRDGAPFLLDAEAELAAIQRRWAAP